jgi:SAM-dependent methyltransferase
MKSTAALALSLGRPSLPEPRNGVNQVGTGVSTRSDIYSRPTFTTWNTRARAIDARFFARLLARVRPPRALELACGSGRVTFTLAAVLPMAEIVGVDSSIDMLAKGPAAETFLYRSSYAGFDRFCGFWRLENGLNY